MSGFLAFLNDVEHGFFFVNVVDSISIVPEDPKIAGGSLHGCKRPYRLVAVADALRIGVYRYAPHALYVLILCDKLSDGLHIRAVLKERNRNHLNP